VCSCVLVWLQVPLEDDQIFLHIGELQYVAARQQGKSATQAYYLPSKVRTYMEQPGPAASCQWEAA